MSMGSAHTLTGRPARIIRVLPGGYRHGQRAGVLDAYDLIRMPAAAYMPCKYYCTGLDFHLPVLLVRYGYSTGATDEVPSASYYW